jgi:Xaa-Pro aminopeptidase
MTIPWRLEMYVKRILKFRSKMQEKGLDAALLIGDPNRNYMSGFKGDESFSLITKDKAIFMVDSRFIEQATNEVKDYDVVEYSKNGETLYKYLQKLVNELNIKKLGFEEDIVTYLRYKSIMKATACDLIPLNGMVEELRVVKNEDEIDIMQKAADIADAAFSHMLEFIKIGMTEREIGIELEFTMKKLGASGLSFPSIVASGARSSLPHGQATDKKIADGEFLTLDFGCVYNEYCSDMTRTVAIGNITAEMKKIYSIVLEAQMEALKSYKSGVTGKSVDKVARDIIKSYGYGDKFGHSLGHGVGRQIHEQPAISSKSEKLLQTGMVVTDEPGIYISGFCGVRIEDILVITDEGSRVLSKSPKDLKCIGD